MNKVAVGVVALIVVLGIVAGVTFFNHSGSSKPSISIPTNVSQLVHTTTITATTNNQNQHQIISGKILYEIIAPVDSRIVGNYYGNSTVVWVVFNITNPTKHVLGVYSSHLNGYSYLKTFDTPDDYPVNAPKYSHLGEYFIGPNSSSVGWIAYEVPNVQDAVIKNVTFHLVAIDTGDQYNVILYPTSNYTVLYADTIYILNGTVNSGVYPYDQVLYVIPGKNASVEFVDVFPTYNYVTILGFSSPLIKMVPKTFPASDVYIYVNITVTKFVPYVIYTYFYAKGENNPPQ